VSRTIVQSKPTPLSFAAMQADRPTGLLNFVTIGRAIADIGVRTCRTSNDPTRGFFSTRRARLAGEGEKRFARRLHAIVMARRWRPGSAFARGH